MNTELDCRLHCSVTSSTNSVNFNETHKVIRGQFQEGISKIGHQVHLPFSSAKINYTGRKYDTSWQIQVRTYDQGLSWTQQHGTNTRNKQKWAKKRITSPFHQKSFFNTKKISSRVLFKRINERKWSMTRLFSALKPSFHNLKTEKLEEMPNTDAISLQQSMQFL